VTASEIEWKGSISGERPKGPDSFNVWTKGEQPLKAPYQGTTIVTPETSAKKKNGVTNFSIRGGEAEWGLISGKILLGYICHKYESSLSGGGGRSDVVWNRQIKGGHL